VTESSAREAAVPRACPAEPGDWARAEQAIGNESLPPQTVKSLRQRHLSSQNRSAALRGWPRRTLPAR